MEAPTHSIPQVTLQNWPQDLATIRHLLETITTPYLKTTLKHHHVINDEDVELVWVPSNFVFS